MTEPTGSHHRWPEEETAIPDVPPPQGLLARIGRLLGHVLLTAGIGTGLASTRAPDDQDAMTNVILFEEGRSRVREARRRRGRD